MLKQQRLEYVDVMRGIAIILVVVQHILQTNGFGKYCSVSQFILSFHMPLFFAISGYITQKVTCIDSFAKLKKFFYKKIISIALPCLVWTVVVSNFFFSTSWPDLNMQSVLHSIMHPGLWFLKSLFLILVAYGVGNYVYNKLLMKSRLLAAALFFLCTFLIIAMIYFTHMEGMYIFMYSLLFMGGVFLSLFPKVEQKCLSDSVSALAFVCFATLVAHWVLNGNIVDDLYKIILSSTSFIILLNFTTKFNLVPRVSNMFQLFGRESLSIYVSHFYLCCFYNFQLTTVDVNPCDVFVLTFILAIGICYLCSIFSVAIKKNKYLGLFLFGKRLK